MPHFIHIHPRSAARKLAFDHQLSAPHTAKKICLCQVFPIHEDVVHVYLEATSVENSFFDILPDSMEQCQLIVATEQDSYFQKILQTVPSKGTNRT